MLLWLTDKLHVTRYNILLLSVNATAWFLEERRPRQMLVPSTFNGDPGYMLQICYSPVGKREYISTNN